MIEPLKMFSPKLEITPEHREYFAGRRDDFRHALDAIAVPGSAYALAGEGGVGKTSLALQLKDILQGETTLLDTLGIRSELTSSVKRYKCAWLKVTTGIDDIETLLAALMEESELPWSLYALFPKAFTVSKQPEEMTRDYEGNLGVFKAKAQFKSTLNQHDADRRDIVAKSSIRARTHREFQNLLARISKHYSDSVIIFIDDFQRVKNREGMGELIKDTDQARFFVVGIADDVRELIRDHPGRKLEGSTRILRPMAEGDVLEILNRAEQQYPGVITFADDPILRGLSVAGADDWVSLCVACGKRRQQGEAHFT